jgi:outer membrane receptor protein involved in Fe transport
MAFQSSRVAAALVAIAALVTPAAAQQATRDTSHQHSDTLTRRPITLEPVTVTAAPTRREEPASAIRITPAIVQRTPALNTWDLLRLAAGLEVHDQGQGPGFASTAALRGFSSDHSTDLALWVDGVPNNEPVNGHAEGYNDWNLLFPGAIETIDVIKGPTSALYGNFAMAGVVNVRTLEHLQGTRLMASGGSGDRFDVVALTGMDQEAMRGVLGIRGLYDGGWRPNSRSDVVQAHGRLVRDLSPSTTLDAGVEFFGATWDSPGFLADSEFDSRLYSLVVDPTDGGFKRRAQERVSLRVLPGASLLWRTTLYATQGRWQLFLTVPPEPGAGEGTGSQTNEEDERTGVGLTSALTWMLPSTEITVGTEGRWDKSDYQNWLSTTRIRNTPLARVSARQSSGAFFVQSTTDVAQHLRVAIGGRYDALSTASTPTGAPQVTAGHGVFSPKLGALYHMPGGFGQLYVNVSRGFRQTDGVISDPTLPYITEWAYETGLKLDARGWSLNVALFRMDVSNEQTFDPITLTSVSGGASRRRGLEAGAEVRVVEGVTLSGDWTINDAHYLQLISEDGDTLNDARVFNTAKYVGIASLEVAPPTTTWHIRVSTNVVGPYTPFDEAGVELPAYGLLHASGGLMVSGAALELGVRNVLDHAYPELAAGGFVSPGQPRSVVASVRYAF